MVGALAPLHPFSQLFGGVDKSLDDGGAGWPAGGLLLGGVACLRRQLFEVAAVVGGPLPAVDAVFSEAEGAEWGFGGADQCGQLVGLDEQFLFQSLEVGEMFLFMWLLAGLGVSQWRHGG